MKQIKNAGLILGLLIISWITEVDGYAQSRQKNAEIDRKVEKFLSEKSGQWRNMNVPTIDGKKLYDLIIENNYKSALEIGTSTGHSGIYIAWALSKTGGKLITIEIDEGRYSTAIENFKEAGLSEYIDARLADAHTLIRELPGPFDFVFSDADKGWYKKYFLDVDPKLLVGGCYTTHNISDRSRYGRGGWNQDYLDFIRNLENYESTLYTSGRGLLISFKRAE